MENEKVNELNSLERAKSLIAKNNKVTVEKEIEAKDIIEKEVPFDFDSMSKNEKEAKEVEVVKEEPKAKKKLKKIDVNKLSVIDKDVISKERDLRNALYGNKSAFQIIAAQSGYMAKVIPLVHKDVINLLYSNLNRYEYKKSVYKVIYDKVVAFSAGSMSFDEWLRATSVEDLETFFYGIYSATFPNEGSFSLQCPACGEDATCKINNENLIKTTDRSAMKKLIDKVSKEATTREAMQRFTLVGKTDAFELPDSKIIVELRTPSLWDSLEILRLVPESVIDRDTVSVTNMLYISRVLIPTKEDSKQYVEQSDSQELLRIIDNLSVDDAEDIQDAVFDRVDEHRITYSIKKVKCPSCGHEVDEIPLSIEDILFTLIFEKAQ